MIVRVAVILSCLVLHLKKVIRPSLLEPLVKSQAKNIKTVLKKITTISSGYVPKKKTASFFVPCMEKFMEIFSLICGVIKPHLLYSNTFSTLTIRAILKVVKIY